MSDPLGLPTLPMHPIPTRHQTQMSDPLGLPTLPIHPIPIHATRPKCQTHWVSQLSQYTQSQYTSPGPNVRPIGSPNSPNTPNPITRHQTQMSDPLGLPTLPIHPILLHATRPKCQTHW